MSSIFFYIWQVRNLWHCPGSAWPQIFLNNSLIAELQPHNKMNSPCYYSVPSPRFPSLLPGQLASASEFSPPPLILAGVMEYVICPRDSFAKYSFPAFYYTDYFLWHSLWHFQKMTSNFLTTLGNRESM